MSIVVFDVETDCSFKSLEGMPREQQMRVMQATVVCALVFDSRDSIVPGNWEHAIKAAEKHTFWRDVSPDNSDPFAGLLLLFDNAEVIVAYNGLGFDLPILRKHYGSGRDSRRRYMEHRMKMLDPMLQVAQTVDMPYCKLDKLLLCNDLPNKNGNGLDAIKMWEENRRAELESYCAQDVQSLAQLVHRTRLHVAGVGWMPNAVHGVASALLRQRALKEPPSEEEFVLVCAARK